MEHSRLVVVRRGLPALLFVVAAGCASIAPDPVLAAREFDPSGGVADDGDTIAMARGLLRDADSPDGSFLASDERCEQASELVDEHPDSAFARTAWAVHLAAEALLEDPPELQGFRLAEAEFLKAERLAPADPEIARWHARFLVLDGHLDAAADRLDRALAQVGNDRSLLLEAARLHFDRGSELRTIDLCERLVALGPVDSQVLWMLAESRLRSSAAVTGTGSRRRVSYQRAIDAFTRYRNARPDDLDGALGEAAARHGYALEAENPVAAAEELAEFYALLLERWPGRAELLHGSGTAAELAGDRDLAATFYRRAIEADPDRTDSHLNLCALLAASGDRDEAASHARRALELDRLQPPREQLDPNERRALEEFIDSVESDG